MQMATDGCAVDKDFFQIGVAALTASRSRCHTPVLCQREKRMYVVCQLAQHRRQIAPGRAGSQHPHHRLDEPSVVCSGGARIRRPVGQKVFDPLPLVIA